MEKPSTSLVIQPGKEEVNQCCVLNNATAANAQTEDGVHIPSWDTRKEMLMKLEHLWAFGNGSH